VAVNCPAQNISREASVNLRMASGKKEEAGTAAGVLIESGFKRDSVEASGFVLANAKLKSFNAINL
jgi:hypothetical protein